ncbi:immunoglobulin-like domain-containing protein [Falsibacillus pallidus]|uniref:Uncharacterized protein n=1 Tax=Falsibacillus pallidus TaxID=493781 RepID=A0A370G8L9_9BACI|nr:immunoglobulin-like domain-containing protein [Falsibacillus pallidus]RDI40148.1 hypothetical protein DFR59_11264 [Falsibacillus pallidus]
MFKRFSTLIIIVLVLLGGCESQHGSVQKIQSKPPGMDLPHEAFPINHEIMDHAVIFSSKSYIQSLDASFKKSGFGDLTSLDYHGGKIMERSEYIKVDVPKLIKEGYTYESSLYHYNDDKNEFELIKKLILDKTKHRYGYLKLLDDQNKAYYMKSVLINPDDKVEETSYSRIFVPYKYENYRIDVDKDVYYPSETVKVSTTNLGTDYMTTGIGGHLEKWTGSEWKEFKYSDADGPVTLVEIMMPPNGAYTTTIPVKMLTPGFYRMTSIRGNRRIGASFEVKEAKTRE